METWMLFRSLRSMGEVFRILIWMKVSEKKIRFSKWNALLCLGWWSCHCGLFVTFLIIYSIKQFSCITQYFTTLASFVTILGFLLDKKVGINQPKRIENARILIANTPMDADKIKVCLLIIFCHYYYFLFAVILSCCDCCYQLVVL